MEIRQLRYFLAIYDSGTLFNAAQTLFISQQALSKSLASLESELGFSLFHRTPRGMIPTEEALLLSSLSRPIVASMDNLASKMVQVSKMVDTHLNIGIAPGLQYYMSPSALADFSQQNPGIDISFQELVDNTCEHPFKGHEITAALTTGPSYSTSLLSYDFCNLRRVAILPKDSVLCSHSTIHIQDFKGKLLALNINETCCQRFISLCQSSGFTPKILRVSDTTTMFSMCRHQGYIGMTFDFILSYFSSDQFADILIRPIDPNEFSTPMIFLSTPEMFKRKSVQRFYEFAKTVIQEKIDQDTMEE